MCPSMPCRASLTASPSVGCAKTTRDSSVAVRSQVWAALSIGSNSVTSGPIMCAPMISLWALSATILTKPTASPSPCALPLAENGKVAVLTS